MYTLFLISKDFTSVVTKQYNEYFALHKHVSCLCTEEFFLNGMPYDATSTLWQCIGPQSVTVKKLQNWTRSQTRGRRASGTVLCLLERQIENQRVGERWKMIRNVLLHLAPKQSLEFLLWKTRSSYVKLLCFSHRYKKTTTAAEEK